MARLPVPGSDSGTWGQVLNDYLSVSHDSDGSIKASAVDTTALQDASITSAKLDTGSGTNGQVLTKNSSATGGFEWTSAGSSDPSLGGDLSGTASNAQIVANAVGPTELAANAVTTAKIADGNVTDAKIATGVSQSKITNLTSDLAAKAGAATTITAGTGLTGGGDISTNRTISANFGTTSGTVAEGNHTHTLTFSLTSFFKTGALTATTGTQRLPIDGTYTIVGTRLMVGTAPTGASIIVDINKNGTTIYSTQANRPSIAAGANSGGPGAAPDVASLAAGDYLTVDVDQIGSTVAGSDLTVSVIVTKTV